MFDRSETTRLLDDVCDETDNSTLGIAYIWYDVVGYLQRLAVGCVAVRVLFDDRVDDAMTMSLGAIEDARREDELLRDGRTDETGEALGTSWGRTRRTYTTDTHGKCRREMYTKDVHDRYTREMYIRNVDKICKWEMYTTDEKCRWWMYTTAVYKKCTQQPYTRNVHQQIQTKNLDEM